MTWTDQVGNLLKQYTSGGAAAQPAPDVHAHFDEVAQAAPLSSIAEGLSAAFKSDKTPAFGEMLTTLFNNSSGDQKAGMVNHLLSSVSPDILKQVLSGTGLAGLAGMLGAGNTQLTPEQLKQPIPVDAEHRHFGGGQTEVVLTLPPGQHTLQLVLADGSHLVHEPPVVSPVITVTVK